MRYSYGGFTLIELLIVIAIIAILAAILMSSLGENTISRSRDAKRISDVKAMQDALELYAIDHFSSYPAAATDLEAALVPGYIPALPSDPLHDQSGNCDASFDKADRFPFAVSDNSDYGYRYLAASGAKSYVVQACLKDVNSPVLEIDCDNTLAIPACFDDTDDSVGRIYDLHS